MKKFKKLKDAFGLNELLIINFPSKMSSTKVSRIINGENMGCSWCFPHGYETINASSNKYQRSWKKFRDKQWK
jgi:hypothetical protein